MDIQKIKALANELLHPKDRFTDIENKFEWKSVANPTAVLSIISRMEKSEALLAELAKREPVAWGIKSQLDWLNGHKYLQADLFSQQRFDEVPLYTRPAPPAPVKLPKRMRIEGGAYCTAQAYYDENGDYYDRLDLLEALRAAGVEVADE